jgi:transposase
MSNFSRFIGLDIHKKQASYAMVDKDKQLLKEGFFLMTEMADWAKKNLTREDAVVIEATGNSYYVYDLLAPYAGEVQIANPLAMHDRTRYRRKTDKADARNLAEQLAMGNVLRVWVPDKEDRAWRETMSYRKGLAEDLTALKNRMRSLLYRHGISYTGKEILSEKAWEFVQSSAMSRSSKRVFQSYQAISIKTVEEIALIDRELAKQSLADPCCLNLMTMPGIKAQAAIIITSAIGEISRFPNPKKLASYAGLVPSVQQSGEGIHYGSITKQGSSLLRWIMVEAAHAAAATPGPLQDFFYRLYRRNQSYNKSIIALASKMLRIIWIMLTYGAPYRYHRLSSLNIKFRSVLRTAFGRCPRLAGKKLVLAVLGLTPGASLGHSSSFPKIALDVIHR